MTTYTLTEQGKRLAGREHLRVIEGGQPLRIEELRRRIAHAGREDAIGWIEDPELFAPDPDPTAYACEVFDSHARGEFSWTAWLPSSALPIREARLLYIGAFTAAVLEATAGDLSSRPDAEDAE